MVVDVETTQRWKGLLPEIAQVTLDAVVLGISPDSPFANAKFAEVHGITFPLLSDLHLEATKAFGVEFPNFAFVEGYTSCNRAVFIIGEHGTVTFEWVGEHPGMQPDYDAVLASL